MAAARGLRSGGQTVGLIIFAKGSAQFGFQALNRWDAESEIRGLGDDDRLAGGRAGIVTCTSQCPKTERNSHQDNVSMIAILKNIEAAI
jgi:hypothetical protein